MLCHSLLRRTWAGCHWLSQCPMTKKTISSARLSPIPLTVSRTVMTSLVHKTITFGVVHLFWLRENCNVSVWQYSGHVGQHRQILRHVLSLEASCGAWGDERQAPHGTARGVRLLQASVTHRCKCLAQGCMSRQSSVVCSCLVCLSRDPGDTLY